MTQKSITFAGHSAVFVEIGGIRVAIDPWLKGNPMCPASLVTPPPTDLIVLTHGHSDHAGDAVRVANETKAQLAATYELAMILIDEGVSADRVVPMNKGGSVQIGNVSIRLTNAVHSSSYDSPTKGTVYAGEPCGVILSSSDWTVYHAGDTALFSDLALIGELYNPDVALLPIGDRFTMGPEEAAKAAGLVKCRAAIPIHYKTFPLLTGEFAPFAAACMKANIEAIELSPGESKRY